MKYRIRPQTGLWETVPQIGLQIAAAVFLLFMTSGSIAAALSEGCGESGYESGVYTMDHEGSSRTFRVHVPRDYSKDKASPLVTIFHGWGGDESEFIGNDTVTSLADERGYILVAPRGLGSGAPDNSFNSWSFSGSTTGQDGDGVNSAVPGDTEAVCDAMTTPDYSYASCADIKTNSCSWTQCQSNDVDFVLALVEEVKANLCVDSGNLFATGGSNGGMFTWELGQNAASASTFRAIAPLIGLPHRGYLGAPGKSGDMPVLLITGTGDNTVPPGEWENPSFTTTSNGSDRYYYSGATAITRSWSQAHSCDTQVASVVFDDGNDNVDCRSYCSEDVDMPRVLDCRAEMGHSYEFGWSWDLILRFFDAHSASATGPAVSVSFGHSGGWFNVDTAGQGIMIEVLALTFSPQ